MLKKILKMLAALALVAVLSFALVAIYSFSTVKIMRSGLDTIAKDADFHFKRSEKGANEPLMRAVWLDEKLGKVAILLEDVSKREKPSIFPSINARDNFALSAGGDALALSNPNIAVPAFFITCDTSKSFGEGSLIEFVCVIFDIPEGKSDLLLKILNAKGAVLGNFEGSDLRFKNFPSKLNLEKKGDFFKDLALSANFKLNASESANMVGLVSDIWGKYNAEKASSLSLGLKAKYDEIIFGIGWRQD